MGEFSNEVFKLMMEDVVNDSFYVEKLSNRGKISEIRKLAEIVVRRILNYSNEEFVTLGNHDIVTKLKEKSNNNELLLESLMVIKNEGNDGTHTQKVEEFSDETLEIVINNLFNLYSYLLIEYFEKYAFGRNAMVMSSFSILPPSIRYIVLNYLYEKDPMNLQVIDKLTLAILKAKGKSEAIEWIEERKLTLIEMSSVSKKAEENIIGKLGFEVATVFLAERPNMYDLCKTRVIEVSKQIEKMGPRYTSFENAVDLYREKGVLIGEEDEIIAFNSIMQFLYLGRQREDNELLDEKYSSYYLSTDGK
ncbi:hypothetical protein I6N96_19205 [Enterococcus sp. BWM-S5]|uniref:DUF4145 domain-containing protein n=2 Tax=Enterococcus larvae TaxID=2794352 RepID=A0ABS4CQF6_9ENTE|nr:hypothetical protein [Enterococcus larvae]MBP1048413.1 hypothetical protein [Enterococcus larvae]